MCISAILGVGSALIGASSASKAASAQKKAAKDDMAFQKETRDIIRGDLAPYRAQGPEALAAYRYNLGLGPAPTIGGTIPQVEEYTISPQAPYGGSPNAVPFNNAGTSGKGTIGYRVGDKTFATRDEAQAYANANPTGGTPYQGFTASPGYQFRFDQGTAAVNALAGARGGLYSGRTMQDLNKFGQGIASEEFNNYMTRLGGLIDTGVGAAGMSGQASQNAAAGVSNALSNKADAAAAGAIGVGNAITGGFKNYLTMDAYQRGLSSGGSSFPSIPMLY